MGVGVGMVPRATGATAVTEGEAGECACVEMLGFGK